MEKIINKFLIEGKLISYERYGEGHINDTYLVITNKNKYILQRINHNVFKDVNGLMENIYNVTSFLKNKIDENNGDSNRETLNIIKTVEGKIYYFDNKNYYRVYLFVEDTITLQKVTNVKHFATTGTSFGKFQKLLLAFDASILHETIKDFHNTEVRFNDFIKALDKDEFNRKKYCEAEIEFVLKRKEDCSKIIKLINEKKIPLRVTHNDTKLNNVLLDEKTYEGLCVIDLDTVMPGSYLYDFGDSIRFGCNSGAEDEKDLTKVNFVIDNFKAFSKAYLDEMKDYLNEVEIDNLAFSGKLMTLECGIRFLTDYLSNDVYFKTNRKEHNLDRCRTQFKLVEQMEENMALLNEIIKKLIKI